jgi:hypothetical protein
LPETASRRKRIEQSRPVVNHSSANLRRLTARLPQIFALAALSGAALYLLLHVAAALIGYRGVAITATVGAWATVIVCTCAAALDRGRQ